jgi:protein O-GlcNAc transferase
MSDAVLYRAQALHNAGKLKEAEGLYEDVLDADPKRFEALHGLAILRFRSGRLEDAARLIGRAVVQKPRASESYFLQASIFQRQGRLEEALAALNHALEARPGYPEALMNRAAALMALGRHDAALQDIGAVLAIDAANAGAWCNRGGILHHLKRHEEAIACFDKALALNPDLFEALVNRGVALAERKRFEEAAFAYEKVVRLNPDIAYARGYLAYYRLRACNWRHLVDDETVIRAGLRAGKRVVQPFIATLLSHSPEEQWLAARISARDLPASATPLWRGDPGLNPGYRHQKIRVAYISADFHAHATAYLMAGLFEAQDRTRFETIAVSLGPDDFSETRSRLACAFDHFLDVRKETDAVVAARIKAMEADIVIDLKGFTNGARPGILAFRCAPVQAQYLGYPGTMGAPYVDYILADRFVIPDAHRAFYTERVVTLPGSYQCNDAKRPIAERTPSRSEEGLPETGFVFCSFSNPAKIRPEVFGIWMRLLGAIDGSVLWLLEDGPDATRNLRREAQTRGIDPSRLVFARQTHHANHLARHRLAGLFLDTQPYGAHTSASDALWTGLPVLTVEGRTFAGRVGTSLVHAVGLPELSAHSLGEYEKIALDLATHPARLAALKTKLLRNRDTCALFDTKRFTRHFETALAMMHTRHEKGDEPADLVIPES